MEPKLRRSNAQRQLLRWPLLAIVALLLQAVSVFKLQTIGTGGDLHRLFLSLSYLLLATVLFVNRRLWGVRILGVALLLNLVPMVGNGGLMPVTPESLAASGKAQKVAQIQLGGVVPRSKGVLLSKEQTNFWILTDIFSISTPVAKKSFSIGDVLVLVGLIVTSVELLAVRDGCPEDRRLSSAGASSMWAAEKFSASPDADYVSLVEAVLRHEPNTAEHCKRLAALGRVVAAELGLSVEEQEHVERGALFHDVGKLMVPRSVLLQPGPLTQEHREIIRHHVAAGRELVERIAALQPIASLIYHHHEHFDGSGYPDGIGGDAIPLGSRIIAVVDAFDAMTNDRPYRTALPFEEAISELKRCAGTQFDPQVVAAFLQATQRVVT